MTVESIRRMAELARTYADEKAAGAPHTVDREHLLHLIELEETSMAEAAAAALRDAQRNLKQEAFQREMSQAKLDIEAASRSVLIAMELFALDESCPLRREPGSPRPWAERLTAALDAQQAVIEAIRAASFWADNKD